MQFQTPRNELSPQQPKPSSPSCSPNDELVSWELGLESSDTGEREVRVRDEENVESSKKNEIQDSYSLANACSQKRFLDQYYEFLINEENIALAEENQSGWNTLRYKFPE